MTRRLAPLALAAAVIALPACDTAVREVTLQDRTATEAAPAEGPAALYALRLADPAAETLDAPTIRPVGAADAATTRWDVGFAGATVVLNSGASGPGAAVGTVVDAPFESVTWADSLGVPFRRDGESACPEGPARAVCPPGDSPFALFRAGAAGPEPVPGRTLVFRLADAAGFAKLEVLAYDAEAETVTVRYLANPGGAALQAGRTVEVDL